MNNTRLKRLRRLLTIFTILVCYCSSLCFGIVAEAIAKIDYIPDVYHGSYNCETVSNHWIKVTSGTTSVFRGYYAGEGVVACSELNTANILFDPDLQFYGDNFVFTYDSWASQSGDVFVPESGSIEIGGNFFNRTEEERRVRISDRYYSE